MKFSLFSLASLFVATVLATPIASPRADTPPTPPGPDRSKVFIKGVSYGGSGCPQGSVGVSLSTDRTTFTLIFDKYVASISPGPTDPAKSRKNCQIAVNMQYPGGFQYSVFKADYRGFVELDKGVTGTQKSTYYFSGQTAQASTQTIFKGPISKDYLISDAVPFTSTVWAPCGASMPLNINSQIRLENNPEKTGSGLLTTDSVDGKVKFICGVQWRTCK